MDKRDKMIFVSMYLKTVLDRCLEDGFRQSRTLPEILQEFPDKRVMTHAAKIHDDFYPAEEVVPMSLRATEPSHITVPGSFGGPEYGVPVLNSPAPPQQAHTSPVATPDGPLPWNGNFHPNVSPADMSGNPKWLGFVPFKGKSGAMCAETGYPWAETTYAMLMNRMMPVVDEDGKPKFGTAWGTLAWLIETSDPTHMQYGKNNTYKIAQCKAVMLEVGRRNPPEPHTPVRERGGRFVESAAETTAMMHEKGFVMAEDQPPMPVVADNDEEWGNISTPF